MRGASQLLGALLLTLAAPAFAEEPAQDPEKPSAAETPEAPKLAPPKPEAPKPSEAKAPATQAPPPSAPEPKKAPRKEPEEEPKAPQAELPEQAPPPKGAESAPAKAPEPEAARRPHCIGTFAGLRTLFVLGDGYEPFAKHSLFWSAALGASVRVSPPAPLTFAIGVALDLGQTSSSARGADTRLSMQRLTLGPELRHELSPRFSAIAHVGLGAGRLSASYEDRVIGEDRVDKNYFFTADAALGLAFRVGSLRRGPGIYLSAEGGYLYTPKSELELTSSDAPARSAPLRFPDLSLSGPYTRFGLTLTF